nr:hypothetical protein [Angustibacter aerolatus]
MSVRGISRSVVLWVVPWLLVGLLALLLVALFVLLVRRRRRRTGQRRRAAQPATPAGRARHREPAGRAARNASRPGRVLPGAARSLAVAGLLTAAGVVLVPPAPASASSTVPYRDVASSGRITLCSNGKPVTTGRVGSDPFVTTAVGESAATEGYGGDGRTAVLSAYQPRQGVSPGEWSGMQVTASTLYARAAHPTARFTRGDYRLSDFLEAYPAGWQGRVQAAPAAACARPADLHLPLRQPRPAGARRFVAGRRSGRRGLVRLGRVAVGGRRAGPEPAGLGEARRRHRRALRHAHPGGGHAAVPAHGRCADPRADRPPGVRDAGRRRRRRHRARRGRAVDGRVVDGRVALVVARRPGAGHRRRPRTGPPRAQPWVTGASRTSRSSVCAASFTGRVSALRHRARARAHRLSRVPTASAARTPLDERRATGR